MYRYLSCNLFFNHSHENIPFKPCYFPMHRVSRRSPGSVSEKREISKSIAEEKRCCGPVEIYSSGLSVRVSELISHEGRGEVLILDLRLSPQDG